MKRLKTSKLPGPMPCLALLLALCTTTFGQNPGAAAPKPVSESESPEARQRRETFELVWETVNKNFYDSNFNGVNWKAVHDRYAPHVARATSDHELYALL